MIINSLFVTHTVYKPRALSDVHDSENAEVLNHPVAKFARLPLVALLKRFPQLNVILPMSVVVIAVTS